MKAKPFKIMCFSIAGVLLAVFLAFTIACGVMADTITTLLCSYETDEETMNAARLESTALADQIEGEGIVMVQNNDGVLPLSKTDSKKVNVFGWSSTQWIAGGSGSGQSINKDGENKADTDLLKALTDAGYEYNTELTSMYTKYLGERPYFSTGALNSWSYQFSRLYEPSISDKSYYSDSLLENAKNYSETALVVIGRVSGESNDQPKVQYKGVYNEADFKAGKDCDTSRTYLEISTEEEALLKYVGENYKNVVVIVNSMNVMELGFMETIPGLDSCLIVGGTGTNAATAIPKVLYGDVNPSGKVSDTYAYAIETSASYVNSGGFEGMNQYTNATEAIYPLITTNGNVGDNTTKYEGVSYVDYVENIYIGYKWYETADAEGYWDDKGGYDKIVQYPFGYGMSYTKFSWEIVELNIGDGSKLKADDTITMTVRVTNTGEKAGQDVVELYSTPPYYEESGIEKAEVNLVNFAKTQIIKPDQYEDVKLTVKVRDLASYDVNHENADGTHGAYVLEHGGYKLSLRTDAHNEKEILNTPNSVHGEAVIDYTIDNDLYITEETNGAKISNKFTGDEAIDGISLDGSDSNANIKWLTRADFEGTFPSELADAREMTQNLIDTNLYTAEDSNAWIDENDAAVTFNANNGLKIYDENGITELGLALGKDYNDSRWDALLDQLDKDEVISVITYGYGGNGAFTTIGKPKLTDLDGPSQIGSFGMAIYMNKIGTGFPNPTVLGQTWSKKLAYDFGLAIGKEGAAMGINGWYGSGINMHRSAFGGRNFEYYGEDSYHIGIIAANAVKAAKNAGMYSYIKHLALYDNEWNRDSLYVWTTEQALREIYLEPFYLAITEGGATGVMSAYNRIGAIWAGGSEALIGENGILRGEWGFKGAVLTDYADHHEYMNGDQMLRAGGDLWMSGFMPGTTFSHETESNSFDQAIRRAAKNITYMYLNALYTNSIYNESEDVTPIIQGVKTDIFPWWIPVLVVVDILVAGGCAVLIIFGIRKKDKVEQETA